ncbi:MAG: hypothetical protein H6735_25835 [Alphaproteobacteria bacterium]|nr:hypothetical protein [Alphaproteobacteria bacterium]
MEKAREAGPLLSLEGGLSLAPTTPATSEVDLEQRRVKAELIAASFAADGIDAMALGASDWTLGTEAVRSLVEKHQLPVLAANLTCDGQHPYPPSKVLESAGHKVGVIGVTMGPVEGCDVGDARQAVAEAVQGLGPVDVVVALVPADSERAVRAFAAPTHDAAPLGVDVVIDGRGRPASAGVDEHNGSWYAGAGNRGKWVGFLDLRFVPGSDTWFGKGAEQHSVARLDSLRDRYDGMDDRIARTADPNIKRRLEEQKIKYEEEIRNLERELEHPPDLSTMNLIEVHSIELGADVPDQAAAAERVKLAKQAVIQASGQDPSRFVPRLVDDTSSPYAGGEACVGCHREEHAQWSTTAHARAFQSLVTVQRALDAQCYSCHVTGAGLGGGPQDPMSTAGFRDVQCEACHGAARGHAADPAAVRTTKPSPNAASCTKCHDGEQDQGRFEPDSYMSQIVHRAPATP